MKSIKQFLTSNFSRNRHIKVNVEPDDTNQIIQIEPKATPEKAAPNIIMTKPKQTVQSPKSEHRTI